MDATRKHPRPRHDRWTIERQALFLATLDETGSVSAAAVAAGMNRASAYRLRDRPPGLRFSRAWDAALAKRRGRTLQAHLAKATLQLVRRDQADKSDTLRRAARAWKSGESDTSGQTARHGQASQPCRLPQADQARLWALVNAAASATEMRGTHSNFGSLAPKSTL